LVVDAGGFTALEAVRALAAAGWAVDLLHRPHSLAARSRHVRRRVPMEADSRHVPAEVQQVLRAAPVDLLFATGDADLLALSAGRSALSVRVPWPAHEVVALAHDKRRLADAAAAAGLRVPREVPVDLAAAAGETAGWAVKPREHGAGVVSVSTVLVQGAFELGEAVDKLRQQGGEPVVQEALTGDLVAYVAVLDRDGSVLAELQQVADQVYPVGAGNCVRGRTTPVDRSLADGAARLLRSIGWTGLVQLEYVWPPGEEPALVDLNGRFYGSMALARGAGLNLAEVEADRALGRPRAAGPARVGARYSATALDVRAALGTRRPRAVSRAVARAVGATHPVWEASDPRPLTAAAAAAARAAGRRLRGSA